MNAADRRMEIISALMHRHHSTMEELAWEFDVCRRTIMCDISILRLRHDCDGHAEPEATRHSAKGKKRDYLSLRGTPAHSN